MKSNSWRIIFGLLLLVFGVLALLQSFNIIQTSSSLFALVPATIFLLGGLAFLNVLSTDRRQWWAVIPGVILASIGLLILVSTLFPSLGGILGGLIVLGGIGAAFWAVYFPGPAQLVGDHPRRNADHTGDRLAASRAFQLGGRWFYDGCGVLPRFSSHLYPGSHSSAER
jgi:hypothetical protein